MSIDVQDVFNKVIKAKLYSEDEQTLMCYALTRALSYRVINKEEYLAAKVDINLYLGGFTTLAAFLTFIEFPNSFNDRLGIYQNWANRP